MSSTTGMNIATTGVLLRNALSVVTGVSSRTRAERAVFGWPMIGAGDELHRAGLHEPRDDDEQHADGDQAGVPHAGDGLGDARQHLAMAHFADGDQQRQRPDHDDVGRQRFAHQHDENSDDDRQGEPGFPIHVLTPPDSATRCDDLTTSQAPV